MGKMPGRYYRIPHGPKVEFIDRSGLGGHWWEGKPFQTGTYATEMDPPPVWVDGALPPADVYGVTCDPCAPFHSVEYTGGIFHFWRNYPAQPRVKVPFFFVNQNGISIWQEDLGGGHINEVAADLGTCKFQFLKFPGPAPGVFNDYWYLKDPAPYSDYVATIVYESVAFWWTKPLTVTGRVELDIRGRR